MQDGKIGVVVGAVTDDIRVNEVPVLKRDGTCKNREGGW
jgi:hypothetical protein